MPKEKKIRAALVLLLLFSSRLVARQFSGSYYYIMLYMYVLLSLFRRAAVRGLRCACVRALASKKGSLQVSSSCSLRLCSFFFGFTKQ